MILELAENANTYQQLGPCDERIVDDAGRYVLWIGEGRDPTSCVAQRFRLAGESLEGLVREVRTLVGERGRAASTWEVAASATPAGLVEQLLGLGMTVEEPLVVGMALRGPLAEPPPQGIVARKVCSVEEMVQATRVQHAAFAVPGDVDVERCARRFAAEGERGATFVALAEGEIVAAAYASFTPFGVLLFGGATAPEARGRGAYRALVQARYDAALDRGTPTLVTHASPMSRPILSSLGFDEVSTLTILLDSSGEPVV